MPIKPESPQKLMTVTEVAEWLNMSSSLVYQLVESGKLTVYRIGNGRGAIRFRMEDVETYLEDCRSEQSAPNSSIKRIRPHLKHLKLD